MARNGGELCTKAGLIVCAGLEERWSCPRIDVWRASYGAETSASELSCKLEGRRGCQRLIVLRSCAAELAHEREHAQGPQARSCLHGPRSCLHGPRSLLPSWSVNHGTLGHCPSAFAQPAGSPQDAWPSNARPRSEMSTSASESNGAMASPAPGPAAATSGMPSEKKDYTHVKREEER